MPPKRKITREEITEAALSLLRERGEAALNARDLAGRLGCSTQPIFSNFASMEELRGEVIKGAYKRYCAYLEQDVKSGEYPPFKASGIAYVRFAREEREMFKLLFMRDRSAESPEAVNPEAEALIDLIAAGTGLDRETARRVHLEMWVFVHGIATMIATSYLDWQISDVSRILSEVYLGVTEKVSKENKKHERN